MDVATTGDRLRLVSQLPYTPLTVTEPWAVIPLNAALHATAAVVLIVIIQRLTSRWQYALLASLPFIFYPSAMTWYTQLHKDGFFILGSLVFFLGWVMMVERIDSFSSLKRIIKPYLFIIIEQCWYGWYAPMGCRSCREYRC